MRQSSASVAGKTGDLMRTVSILAAVLFAAAAMAPSLTGTTASSTGQSAQSNKAQCDAQRKVCYAGKTQTGSYGAQYVAPEDVRMCEAAYRMCTGRH
jgi:Ni/Co efflux regulator RcnB